MCSRFVCRRLRVSAWTIYIHYRHPRCSINADRTIAILPHPRTDSLRHFRYGLQTWRHKLPRAHIPTGDCEDSRYAFIRVPQTPGRRAGAVSPALLSGPGREIPACVMRRPQANIPHVARPAPDMGRARPHAPRPRKSSRNISRPFENVPSSHKTRTWHTFWISQRPSSAGFMA